MEATVQRWGNDFGIRIPMDIARRMSLKTGYKVFIMPIKQEPEYELDALLAGVNKKNMHKEVSFGKSVGKEIW